MSIGKADAKIEDIDRRIFKGRRTTLQLIDRFNGNVVVGAAKLWNWEKIGVSSVRPDGATYKVKIAEDTTVCTKENLSKYAIAINGLIFDVPARDEPQGPTNILWTFMARPTNEMVE